MQEFLSVFADACDHYSALYLVYSLCFANRSDELGCQYAAKDYHNLTAGINDYNEDDTKPLLHQFELESYAQRAATDITTMTPPSVAYNNTSDSSHITYSPLQPL